MFRLQRFYKLQFCIAFFSNCQISMYITLNFSLETHFSLSYNVIIQLWRVQKEPWTPFPTVSFPKAFSSNHPLTAFLWHRLFMLICWLLSLYTFSTSKPSGIFSLLSVKSLCQEMKILVCVQLLQEGKNKTICWFLEGSGYIRMFFPKENSLRHGVCV